MNYIEIATQIEYDIDMGIYIGYDKLKCKLKCIIDSLILANYVKNKELHKSELDILRENGYLN